MKIIVFFTFLLYTASIFSQQVNRFWGEYCSEGNIYLSISKDGTFTITNNGLCVGVMADGVFTPQDDTIFLTTRHYNDPKFGELSRMGNYGNFLYADTSMCAPVDSIGLVFHDGIQSFVKSVYIFFDSSDFPQQYLLDSSQRIYLPVKKASKIRRITFDTPISPCVTITGTTFVSTMVYHLAYMFICYPAMLKEKFYLYGNGLLRLSHGSDGEILISEYKKIDDK